MSSDFNSNPDLNPDFKPDLDPNLNPTTTPEPEPQVQPEPATPQPTPKARRRAPQWRFWLPLALQALLITAVPARDAYTMANGTPVVLQTAPVDPYDLLRGYYQTLRYRISDRNVLAELPGGDRLFSDANRNDSFEFFVVLRPPLPSSPIRLAPSASRQFVLDSAIESPESSAESSPDADAPPPLMPSGETPSAWVPLRVSERLPENLPQEAIALRGNHRNGRITYGLETYFMPEDRRVEINDRIRQVQREQPGLFVVEVKVDDRAHAVPVSLWVGDRRYQF